MSLILAFILSFSLWAAPPLPPGFVRGYAGVPTAGDCTATSAGKRIASNLLAVPTAYYACKQTGTGPAVYEWVEIPDSAGGGSGDITSVTAGTGLTGGGTSGGVTLALATVTASRALVSDGSGYPTASPVTATELGYLSGVTSAIQTQLGTKATIGTIGTAGRNVYVSGSNTITEDASFTRVAAGQYTLYDATGPTTLTVRAGSGQSSTNLIEFRNSANSLIAYFNQNGTGSSARWDTGTTAMQDSSGILFANNRTVKFSSDATYYGTADLGLSRAAANNLAITNGNSTNYWLMGSNGVLPGADNTYDVGSAAASVRSVYVDTDFIGSSTSCIYLGATGTDGSWRWCRSGNNSVMERRESGSWVSKQVVTP